MIIATVKLAERPSLKDFRDPRDFDHDMSAVAQEVDWTLLSDLINEMLPDGYRAEVSLAV